MELTVFSPVPGQSNCCINCQLSPPPPALRIHTLRRHLEICSPKPRIAQQSARLKWPSAQSDISAADLSRLENPEPSASRVEPPTPFALLCAVYTIYAPLSPTSGPAQPITCELVKEGLKIAKYSKKLLTKSALSGFDSLCWRRRIIVSFQDSTMFSLL